MEKRLTELTKSSGWAAKIGPDVLAQVLCQLPKTFDKNLIVGLETSDDAAVYKVNDDLALIQTLDFFTPVVDDPYMFGQIAAAKFFIRCICHGWRTKISYEYSLFPKLFKPKCIGRNP